jgi:phosphoribosylformylglycinamidine cyclo-ligase
MGHRMELYVDKADAQVVIDISAEFGLEARIIGRCEPASSGRLTIRSEFGEFRY